MTGAVSRLTEFLLLSAVLFGPLAFGCVEPWSLAVLQTLILLVLFFCALQPTFLLNRAVHKTLFPAVLLLLLLGFIQLLCPSPILAPKHLLPFTVSFYGTSKATLLWCVYASLLWSAPQVLRRRGAPRRLLWAIFILGFVVAAIGIIQMSHGNAAIYGFRAVGAGPSPFGPYYNRGHAASMMALSLLVGCGLFSSHTARLQERDAYGSKLSDLVALQLILLFCVSVIACGIFLTKNRGSVLSMSLSAWILAWLSSTFAGTRRRALTLRTLLLLAGAGLAALVCRFPEWIGIVQGSLDNSTSYRMSMYRGGWSLFKDFPLSGTGLGGVINAFPPYKEKFIAEAVDHVHNDWLELLMQSGIVGAALYTLGLLAFSRRIWIYWKNSPSLEQRCLTGGALAAALAFILHGFLEFSFQIPANAVLFFAILSWLGAQSAATNRKTAAQLQKEVVMRPAMRAVLAGLSLCLIGLAVRPAIAQMHARRSESSSPESRAYFLNRAYAWDPNPSYLYALGAVYLKLAEDNPPARKVLLRQALDASDKALRLDPLNDNFRYLEGAILWRLDRIDDAKNLLPSR